MLPRFISRFGTTRAARYTQSSPSTVSPLVKASTNAAEEGAVPGGMRGLVLSVSVTAINLPLIHPFKIARAQAETVARSAVIRVHCNGGEGLGEATPVERYGESVESVLEYFRANRLAADDPYRLEALLHARIPAAARAGLDIALHDLIGKELGKPLYALLGLDPSATPATCRTIGIADPDLTLRKVDEVADHPILKIKLGIGTSSQQIETIAAIRARYGGAIRIDANEGWDVEGAINILRELQRYEIEFCEQPIPAGRPAELRAIRDRVSIPIVADEDALVAGDLPALNGCVDGANVKLAKTGGIRGALAMIHTARAMGLKVMIGCMVESAIAATAAAHLSPLADWADIDGPLLIARDPFAGVTYDRGKIQLPELPGLGVRESVVA
jgi:L-alanine-DL-glutamate epimerase-like enolase superfamily enzyme